MKWTYSIQNKLTASAVLFLLCIVILYNNYNDRTNTSKVIGLVSTLYQDRILAEVYIYKMSSHLFKLKAEINASIGETSDLKMQDLITKINENIVAYGNTKLTKNESIVFEQLKLEVPQNWEGTDAQNAKLLIMSDNALSLLGELSNIQLIESESIVADSQKAFRKSRLSSEFAFAIVIIILIILQALVFASKTLHISNAPVNVSSN